MRALMIATGCASGLEALGPNWPSPMLPVGDRPLVQHVVERLVVAGCRQIDVVLGEAAERVERHLGDGQRWGCQIQYHLTSGFERAASTVAALARQGESFLLAQADILPQISLDALTETRATGFVLQKPAPAHAVTGDWTGWAWIPGQVAATAPDLESWEAIHRWLTELTLSHAGESRIATPGLTARGAEEWLQSQTTALTILAESLHFSAFASDAGIWIGRNVSLPPDVELTAPVLIGDNSQIGSGVRLGPGAVICPSCVIDDRTTVAESVVLEGSYVGRDLDVHGSVINRSRLLNVRLGASVQVTDAFLLGGIAASDGQRGGGAGETLASIAARLALLPLALLNLPLAMARLIAGKWPPFESQPFALTPAAQEDALKDGRLLCCLPCAEARRTDGWRHFWLVFVPGLVAVIGGRLALTGPSPRTASELRDLPEDWRNFCLQCRPGLISESFVIHGPDADDDLRFTSDAMHAATGNWRASLRIAGKYATLLALGRPAATESDLFRRTE